jgi:hypothetical protein
MSDKVPYHAYEKRGKMIEERDKRIAELVTVRDTATQFMYEVAHAMQCGPSWYTRGESGLRSQIHMWIGRMQKALDAAKENDV